MKALVVYDSVFGNTEKIARAMGGALGAEIVKVDSVSPNALAGVTHLLVGSPTRGFRPTPATNQWTKGLSKGSLDGVTVGAFDTRVDVGVVKSGFLTFMVKLFGYAADPIARRLVKKGGNLVKPPEGFIVLDREGPLKDGELERAIQWAKEIAGLTA